MKSQSPQSFRQISEKPTNYSSGVLVGNWLEERVGRYHKNRYGHITLYRDDYKPKQLGGKVETDEMRNDTKIKSEFGDNILPPQNTDEVPNYYDNFTTTYDLSYQYFPHWIRGTLDRKMRFKLMKHEPTDEYLNGYGNLSSRNNLTDDKREEWGCDVLDPRRPVISIAKGDYTGYRPEIYKVRKWPRLGPVKVKCGLATETVYMPLPKEHPRVLESMVNPLTWEGYEEKRQCVCKL